MHTWVIKVLLKRQRTGSIKLMMVVTSRGVETGLWLRWGTYKASRVAGKILYLDLSGSYEDVQLLIIH